MLYSEVAAAYEEMDNTSKRLELTKILADLIKKTPNELVDKVIYLTQGKIYPDFMGIEIGLADRSVIRAIASTSGHSLKEVEKKYHLFGDLGSVAEDLLQNKGQITLFSEQLTIERVHDVLDRNHTFQLVVFIHHQKTFFCRLIQGFHGLADGYVWLYGDVFHKS